MSGEGAGIAAPLAEGRILTVAPDSELQRLSIESRTGTLQLIDGRGNLNNAWYIVRETTQPGATTDAITWIVTPNVDPKWRYAPVVQVSQVGYLPNQSKTVLIETDPRDTRADLLLLYRLTPAGRKEVARFAPQPWGRFLRYNYLRADLSRVTAEGMYVLGYRGVISHPFKIAADVYDRYVWQPTLEYFLPVQMSHMKVVENYRTWHGLDHQDDARMAPLNYNHFDGYSQGPSTLTRYKPGDHVPGLNSGGWHDAGDYDLRVESQMGTVWLLSKMIEEFGLDYDATSIDEERKLTQIHRPDGKNDGKADSKEVVATGFGRSDTHELPNSLTWGPDGWLYGWNGVFNPGKILYAGGGGNTAIGIAHLALGVATVALTVLCGRRLGLRRATFAAGLLVAIDPLLIYQTSLVMTETLVTFLAALLLWFCLGGQSLVRNFALGLAFGLCCLCRPTFWAFGVVAVAVWLFSMTAFSVSSMSASS
jgi:hypothetical protein